MEEISTLEEMDALIHSKGATLLFKYSPTCGISQVAQEAWEGFSRMETGVRLAQCDVVRARPAARGMVEMIGVAHQSPQVLAVRDGVCIAHTSHYGITPDWLETTQARLNQTSKSDPPA